MCYACRQLAGVLCNQAVSKCAMQLCIQQGVLYNNTVSRCAMQSGSRQVCYASRQAAGVPCSHAVSRRAMPSASVPCNQAFSRRAMQVDNQQVCYASRQAAGLPIWARLPTCRPHPSRQPVLGSLILLFMQCRIDNGQQQSIQDTCCGCIEKKPLRLIRGEYYSLHGRGGLQGGGGLLGQVLQLGWRCTLVMKLV